MIILGRLFDKEIWTPDRTDAEIHDLRGVHDKSWCNKMKHTDIDALHERNKFELMR